MIKERKIYNYKGSPVFVIQMNLVKDKETKLIDEAKSRVEVSRDTINQWNPFWVNYHELK